MRNLGDNFISPQSNLQKWQDRSYPNQERLLAFERWVYGLARDAILKNKGYVGASDGFAWQIKAFCMHMIAEMEEKGWFLDGDSLEAVVRRCVEGPLEAIAKKQMDNPYGYMVRVFDVFLAQEADNIKDTAMSLGTHISQVLGKIEHEKNMTGLVGEMVRQTREKRQRTRLKKRSKAKAIVNQLEFQF